MDIFKTFTLEEAMTLIRQFWLKSRGLEWIDFEKNLRSDPALTEDAVMRHCHDNLTGYKCPRFIEFRNDLPKTNVGKVLRRQLRSSTA